MSSLSPSRPSVADVSVVGTGRMGGAIASALLAAGNQVTVWNRTPERTRRLIDEGARLASSAVGAVEAAPIVIVCVINYAASDELLLSPDVTAALQGKKLIQFSSGTSQQARTAAAWAEANDIKYLDGYTVCYHDQIATDDGAIYVSGSSSAFSATEPLLGALGRTTFLGEDPGTTNATLTGSAPFYHGALLGTLLGAAICESESVPMDAFKAVMSDFVPAVRSLVADMLDRVGENRFGDPRALVGNQITATGLAVAACRDHGLPGDLATQLAAYFEDAVARGYGDKDVAVMINAFRASTERVSDG